MKSWKTTLAGLLGGGIIIGQQILVGLSQGQKMDWSQVGYGAALMALGILSKDFNVSGTGQTPPKP